MPRIARIVIPGFPHHTTQRGNHRQRVFFADSEHDRYLALLRKYFTLFHIDTVGYGLMPNHVHHVLIPATPYSLAKGLGLIPEIRDYSSGSAISPVRKVGESIMKWKPSGPPHLRLSFSMTDRMRAGLSLEPET
jgi:hypothetical protein